MTRESGVIKNGKVLLERIQALLDDPAHIDNPLRAVLQEVNDHIQSQNQRMERLLRISDGYQLLEHNEALTLSERCDKQIKRMERLARISDQYQRNLWEVTETLRQAANQDPLTGLANRRFLMERLKEETQRAARKGSRLAIALMDVDHFKQVNDRFGHEVGDVALCEIAGAVRQEVRRYDVYGRWGGEEFLLVLPDADPEEAVMVLERIRQTITALTVGGDDPAIRLSASFGVTLLRSGEDVDDALKRADDALFKAKREGRDRVVLGD
ncbi:biofilm regulation diguanylate cyclase SiaD [Ectothiorhodospira lacustris]|uniref:biofilm regulation diguanylate cyclase SiaD n=1 Tax=Ectothiorhodospira lacustris TaxID=2899127 RepID=UPI001EE8CCB4|nr:biofilm regulation diguanylate cyclase SiaD [Ectothiorhodospira lacustris]MCG5500575.1 biofilm regulation diguanylate cyclase SiaD [Ectothiorhodospira lacustris]MCG5508768.1 biofilm regulation diguanylate cyclase SiaD [Ectothiorhodospira lacustris]MCG5520559.1 biofilm regulation diguanylate cyclase SiaD [Ectothiorhodospira lacustris]